MMKFTISYIIVVIRSFFSFGRGGK